MPDSVCVLVALSVQVLVALLRSEPPVVTKLMLPVSRTKRVIACAWRRARRTCRRAPATQEDTRGPLRRPRMP